MDSTGIQAELDVTSGSRLSALVTQRQRWAELGVVVLIAVAPLTLSAFTSLVYPKTGSGFAAGYSLPGGSLRLAAGLLHQISSLLLVFFLLTRRGQTLKSLGLTFDRWTDWPIGLGLALAGPFLSAILSIVVRSASLAITSHPAEMRDASVIFAGIPTGWFVFYALTAAVFEETIVRAYITSEMIALAAPVWLATLTSVVLQTSYHVYYGWGGALAVSGIFIVFGIYFAITRRLLPLILAHFFFDLLAILARHPH
jgi:membrane protease YdiL (CAAX protease family)